MMASETQTKPALSLQHLAVVVSSWDSLLYKAVGTSVLPPFPSAASLGWNPLDAGFGKKPFAR